MINLALLLDNKGKQISLMQNALTKQFFVSVYNKETHKTRMYKDKQIMCRIITDCIMNSK